jgi:toxin YoeB
MAETSRQIIFSKSAQQEFDFLKKTLPIAFEKLLRMLGECLETPFQGIGKPEPLKGNLTGFWSRRITDQHRLVYKVTSSEIIVVQCLGHY